MKTNFVQLAKKADLSKVKFPVIAELKYDGVRTIIIKKDGNIRFFTRNQKEFFFPKLAGDLDHKLSTVDNIVIDSELLYIEGGLHKPRKIAGKVNSSIHGGDMWDSDDGVGIVQIAPFDFLQLKEFEERKCDRPYYERRATLSHFFKNHENIKVCDNADEVFDFYERKICNGFEGLILKAPDSKYTFRRDNNWLKMKAENTCLLKCVGFKQGMGKYKDMLGSLVCSGEEEGYEIFVNVGSGLSDLDRANADKFKGAVVEVKYNSICMDNATGKHSLFLPVYKGIVGVHN